MSLLTAFILCALLPTQSTLAQTDVVFSLYENPSLGLKIQYPYDWEWKHDYDEVHFSLPQDDAGFQLVVSVYPTTSLDQLILTMPERFMSNFGFIESPKKTTLGLYPARMMVYNFTNDEIDVKAMRVLIQGEHTYSINYVAKPAKYNDYLPIIQKMINSFEILVQNALPAKPDFLTYYNSTYGVAIQYPSNWIKDERGDGSDDCHARVVEFSDPSGTNAQLNIYTQYHGDDLYEGDTQKEVLESELEFYRDYQNPGFYDDFKVTTSNINSTLAGYPAYKLEFSNKAGATAYNSVQTGIVIDMDAYFIIADVKAENFSANFPTIQKMIDSFKMKEPNDFVCLESGKPPVPAEDTNKTSTELKPGTKDTNKTSTELKPGIM